jgi:hypothetical protein
MRNIGWLALLASLGGLGCGGGKAQADEASEGDGSTETGGESTEDTGDVPPVDVHARGIRADDVEINQGVAVPIALGGQWIGPTERTSAIYRDRPTLIRVPWTFEADWEPREIEARLVFYSPLSPDPLVASQIRFIDGESHPGDLDRNFAWIVPREQMVPGVEFQVTLYEVDDSHADAPEPDPIPTTPIDGPALLGIEDYPMELKVVLVPVDYTAGNCDTLAIPDEDQSKQFIQYLYERNAVQNVDFRIHDTPIVRDTQLTSLASFFEPLQQYRIMDEAEPNEYYFALVDACASGIGGAGGIAAGTPPATKMAAPGRVCVGLWHSASPSFSYETFVHEIGHTQGRAHTFCPGGGADNPDGQFPNENGLIGVWGFGVETYTLRSPASQFDYMSYCNPAWVSDWNWVKTGAQIKTLTAWDYEGGDAPPDDPVAQEADILVGLSFPGGGEQWWTTRGGPSPSRAAVPTRLTYETPDGTFGVDASSEILDDGSRYFVAPLPLPLEHVRSIRRRTGDEVREIAVSAVSVQPASWEEWHARAQ